MTDEELAEIERVWAAASGSAWRVEPTMDRGRTKLYALSPPNMHDSYLLDLSAGDANEMANLTAIATAPEHVAALLAEVKTLRAVADAAPLTLEVRAIVEETMGSMGVKLAPLRWSRELPTVEGMYWTRNPSSQHRGERAAWMVSVSTREWREPKEMQVHSIGIGCGELLSSGGFDGYEWAGPIPEPR